MSFAVIYKTTKFYDSQENYILFFIVAIECGTYYLYILNFLLYMLTYDILKNKHSFEF